MNFDYDGCLIGAGPVGSTISYYPSLKGLSVVLLDKKTRIGYPLFVKLKENDGEKLISEYGDMDTQSVLIKESIKRGLAFKVIPSFLFKKVGKIFGI